MKLSLEEDRRLAEIMLELENDTNNKERATRHALHKLIVLLRGLPEEYPAISG